jgi:protein-L-isoaspartate(D-aspartate) O-methyltransferase
LTVGAEAEERAQFMLLMRARGVRDLDLLRALERAPRALFMPQRYGDIAGRDIALPIGCGQTAPPPSVLAAMIEGLGLGPGLRVLEIGSGTGYAASLIAQLVQEVQSLERCQSLALEAAARLESLGLDNVKVAWADGLSEATPGGPFDRIIIHALVEEPPAALVERLAENGVIVAGRPGREQRIVKITRGDDGALATTDLAPARSLSPLVPGLTRGL